MSDSKIMDKASECLFCKFVNGEDSTPGVFWEDDEFMAFLSIYPNTEGFTIIIPKEHFGSDVLKMPNDILSRFVIAAKTVSEILMAHFKDVGRVGVIMTGTGIDHAHIKLFPMHNTEHMRRGEWKKYGSDNNKFFQTYEGYISSNEGPRVEDQEIAKLAAALKLIK